MMLLLLALLPVCAGFAFGLAGYGITAFTRDRPPGGRTAAVLRALAAFCGAAAAVVYAWGGLLLAAAVIEAEDDGAASAPLPPCRGVPGREEEVLRVVDYSVSFLPLRFDCELTGGGSYDSGMVSGSVSANAVTLALSGAGLAAAGGFVSAREARKQPRGPEQGGDDAPGAPGRGRNEP
ncbi:hypothetical protein ACWDR0_32520 [Streptomyces sp. NPDC003691]